MVATQIAEVRKKRTLLDEQTKRLQVIKDWDTWLAIASKLPAKPDVTSRAEAAPAQGGKRFRSLTIDGREILVGKGARQNDELTFDVAGPEDFWFHVADYSGSLVLEMPIAGIAMPRAEKPASRGSLAGSKCRSRSRCALSGAAAGSNHDMRLYRSVTEESSAY